MVQKWFGGFNGPDRSRLVKIGPDWSRSMGWNLDQSGVLRRKSGPIWTCPPEKWRPRWLGLGRSEGGGGPLGGFYPSIRQDLGKTERF